ncbi:transposable element Tcb2 transposase [Trichonephila clavipes]|nr:transposable element Tcb2 transposase [Trichonephila clavipes]
MILTRDAIMLPSRQYEPLSPFERERIIGMMETGGSARLSTLALLNLLRGGVGTSGQERGLLHSDQAQDALDKPMVEKTIISYDTHVNFSDEFKFNLGSDDNRVRVWRLRGERLNPAFAVQQHTTPTTSVIVWDFIAYTTWSPLILIHNTMAAQRHASKSFTELSPPHFNLFLVCLIPRFVTDREYLGSFRTASRTAYEFFQIRGAFTATVEQDVAKHHTRLVCPNAQSYHISLSCYR